MAAAPSTAASAVRTTASASTTVKAAAPTTAVGTAPAATVRTAATAAVRTAAAESPPRAGVRLHIPDAVVECPEFRSVLIFLHDLFGHHEALRFVIEGKPGSRLADSGAFACHHRVRQTMCIDVRITGARERRRRDTAKFLRRRTE